MGTIDWTRVRRAFPVLAVATIVIDALLLRIVEPAPPLEMIFWLGVYVGGTFLILLSLFVFWVWSTAGSSTDTSLRDGSA